MKVHSSSTLCHQFYPSHIIPNMIYEQSLGSVTVTEPCKHDLSCKLQEGPLVLPQL